MIMSDFCINRIVCINCLVAVDVNRPSLYLLDVAKE